MLRQGTQTIVLEGPALETSNCCIYGAFCPHLLQRRQLEPETLFFIWGLSYSAIAVLLRKSVPTEDSQKNPSVVSFVDKCRGVSECSNEPEESISFGPFERMA
jgi:hypothetical protein